jgi:hypothetical protein
MKVIGSRRTGRGVAFVLVFIAVLLAVPAAPAAAYQVVGHSGTPGPYQVIDTSANPGATCHYGAANAHGVAAIDFIQGRVHHVLPQGNQSQTVSWQVVVQRQASQGGPWSTVATSVVQKAVASPGAHGSAPFTAIKVLYDAPRDQSVLRALYRIRWYSNSGAVVARVTLWITYYLAVWTVGSSGFVFNQGYCWSSAD